MGSSKTPSSPSWPGLAGLLLGAILAGCQPPAPTTTRILNDFESPADLDRLYWHCRTTFELSPDLGSHGRHGLRLTLYPAPYPGLSLRLTPRDEDWRGYATLSLEVINPQTEPVSLRYRIDDRASPAYGERVNGSLSLSPGENRLRLALAELRTSGSHRPLDLARIQRVILFVSSPSQPVSLGVDHIRLEP